MSIKKLLLAAAGVLSLAAPAAAMAHDYQGYNDGRREAPRAEAGQYDQRRDAGQSAYRQQMDYRQSAWRHRELRRDERAVVAYRGGYDHRGNDHREDQPY